MTKNVNPRLRLAADGSYHTYPGFSVGADPEFFLVDDEGPVSAHDILPGTKNEPFVVEGGAIQVDGTAGEVNINPSTTFAEFNHNCQSVMSAVSGYLPKGVRVSHLPWARFSEKRFAAIPDSAKVLGCSPDMNAWTEAFNPCPVLPEGVRVAGGHLHIGWDEGLELNEDHMRNCFDFTKQLDYFLGAWLFMNETNSNRRLYYGALGAFRPKSYGMEYRTPGPEWMRDSTGRLGVWNQIQLAIHRMSTEFHPEGLTSINQMPFACLNYGMGASPLTKATAEAVVGQYLTWRNS